MVSHRYTPISPGEESNTTTSSGSSASRSSTPSRSSTSFDHHAAAKRGSTASSLPLSRVLFLTLPPLLCSAFLAVCFFLSLLTPSTTSPSSQARPNRNGVTPLPPTLRSDLTLPQTTCRAEFPLFYPQLDDLKRYWLDEEAGRTGIRQSHIDSLETSAKQQDRWGWSRVLLKSNRLWLRTHHESTERGGMHRQRSMLALLQQAVQTSPSADGPLPSIDLLISTGDRDVFGPTYNGEPAWVLAKHRHVPQTQGQWLAPDFGFMAWPEAQLPPHAEVVDLQRQQEVLYPWEKKDDRAFWRGFPNPAYAIRRELMERTRNASHLPASHPDAWADVYGTSFGPEASQPDFAPLVPIEEHCRRKYLLHAEGNSYSGRGKFLLTCHAVTIAHPLDWGQHFHAALIGDREDRRRNWVELPGPGWEGLEEAVRGLWELEGDAKVAKAGREEGTKPLPKEGSWLAAARAKGVFSAEKGSKAAKLTAKDIADNARDSLRDRYLTPAATACYFRAALRAYAESMDVASWAGADRGPQVRPGNGQSPGKDLGQPGAKGDISYESWLAADLGDWPPPLLRSTWP